MIRKPAVSILMPVWNAAPALDAAVQSLLQQSLKDIEIILVDDGSTDGSAEICERFAKADERTIVIHQTHRGIVHALNRGLEACSAPLVARMDADDLCHPHRIEKQVHYLSNHPKTGLVSCKVKFGGDPETQHGYEDHVEWTNSLLSYESIFLNRFVESPFAHPSVMFRKAWVEQLGGYREGDFPEDYELWLRGMEAGVIMEKLPEFLLTWNDLPGRLSRNDPRYSIENFYKIKSVYLAAELKRINSLPLWIWGAGRQSRRRVEMLEAKGISVSGYIDVDEKKLKSGKTSLPVIPYRNLPVPGNIFILSYVGNRGARDLIRAELSRRAYREGKDFLLAS